MRTDMLPVELMRLTFGIPNPYGRPMRNHYLVRPQDPEFDLAKALVKLGWLEDRGLQVGTGGFHRMEATALGALHAFSH